MLQRHIFIYLGGRNCCLGLFRAWGRLDLRRRSLSSRSSLARWGAPASPYILAIIYLSYVSRMLLSFFMIPIVSPPVSFILLKKWCWYENNSITVPEMKNFFILLLSLNYLDIHLALPYSSQCYISQQHKLTIIHFDLISICCTVSHINISKLQNETSAILLRNIPTHIFFQRQIRLLQYAMNKQFGWKI